MVVLCGGRIVAGDEAKSLHSHVHKVFQETPHIVTHLEAVQFIDSSGLGTLVRLASTARAKGGDVKLCAIPPFIRKTLEMTNLHRLFELHATEAEAVAASYQRRPPEPSAHSPVHRVLCVEESPDLLAYQAELLRRAGYQVLTSRNVADARVLLHATKPHLLIVGERVPAADGRCAKDVLCAVSGIPTVSLDSSFGTLDAGDAGEQLLGRVLQALGRG
jgi:anti-anti-sigma factor